MLQPDIIVHQGMILPVSERNQNEQNEYSGQLFFLRPQKELLLFCTVDIVRCL
jgi:hypothetical protein